MNSSIRIIKAFLIASVVFLLLSCGGGSSEDEVEPGSNDPSSAAFTFTLSNSVEAATHLLDPLEFITQWLHDTFKLIDGNTSPPNINTIFCAGGGTMTTAFQDTDLSTNISSTDEMILSYSACTMGAVTTNGGITIRFQNLTNTGLNLYLAGVTFSNLLVTESSVDERLNGTANIAIDFGAGDDSSIVLATLLDPLEYLRRATGSTSTLADLFSVNSFTRQLDGTGISLTIDVDLRNRRLVGSYKLISNLTSTHPNVNRFPPGPGPVLNFSSSNGTRAQIIGNSDNNNPQTIMNVDENAIGGFEATVTSPPLWGQLTPTGFLLALP